MEIADAVKLARDNKNEGYTYLYETTYQKGYYVALKFMKDEDKAVDILQDAYVRAFKHIDQLDEAEKFQAWFGRIVATTALNELKKKSPILFSQMEDEDGNSEVDTFYDDRVENQPELSLDKNETRRLVNEIIDTLSEEQRICITMFYMEEMSVKDIAQILSVSENTVKSRLNYGRQKIKDKVLDLEKQGTKLYGIAPIPFLLLLLRKDVYAQEINQEIYKNVARNIGETLGNKVIINLTGEIAGHAGTKALWMSIAGGSILVAVVASVSLSLKAGNIKLTALPVNATEPIINQQTAIETFKPEIKENDTQEGIAEETQEKKEPKKKEENKEQESKEEEPKKEESKKKEEPKKEEAEKKEEPKKEEPKKEESKKKEETKPKEQPKKQDEPKQENNNTNDNADTSSDDEVEIDVDDDSGDDSGDDADEEIEVE